MDTNTETAQVAALAIAAKGKPYEIKTEKGREFIVMPEGYKAQDVTEPNAVDELLPEHVTQAVTLQTLDSLVGYANRYGTDDTILMADIDHNKIVALIDYHSPPHDDAAIANRVKHTASMVLPLSFEWATWTAKHDKLMPQLDFARFLEENAPDIAAPAGADLLDAIKDLQAKRKVDFRKAVRTSSDNENFEFVDETTVGSKKDGAIEVPTRFLLKIPVYFGRPPVELYAFLRWRLEEGQLLLGVALNRREHVRQAEFKLIVTEAAERTKREAVFGRLGS
jgi:uncharacterized protein YfdQ (DUF2303 family)